MTGVGVSLEGDSVLQGLCLPKHPIAELSLGKT